MIATLKNRVKNKINDMFKLWFRQQMPLIIERMEVDLVFSRLHSKYHLRIMDIGAHYGEFLEIFEHHNDDHTYDVVCIEPMPENIATLKQRIKRYKRVNVEICDVAISDVSGPKTFYQGTADTLFACTEEWKHIFSENFRQLKEVKIYCLTVEDLFD